MSAKKISHRDITGDRGIALIHRIVGEMGFVWCPTGLEAGIDGYIEIRDAVTGDVTNLIIQVQSKATNKDFQAETPDCFDYYCDPRDLEYWLGGNAPIILIVSRPSTDEAYWVSVKDYFKDLSAHGTRKIHFNKSRDRFDVNCRDALISLARPKDVGIYLVPLPKREKLYTNLLDVVCFANNIWVANTDFRSPRTLWGKLHQMGAEVGGEWILKDERIMTFYSLEEYPWSELCDQGTVESFESWEWAYSGDLVLQRDFVRLLNLSLEEKLRPDVRYDRRKNYYFFIATKDLSPRELPYKSLVQNTSRFVFRGYPKENNPTQIAYYRHSAFKGQFVRVGDKWYLEITPTYHYTWDGYKPSFYREELLKGIKRLERNPAVLGQVLMWAEYLREKGDFFTTPYPFLTFGSLVTLDLDAGLDDKRWLRSEGTENTEIVESPINQFPLFDQLSR